MKDFLGNDLEIGDEVVFMFLTYRSLGKGRIVKFTPKTILIEHQHPNLSNYTTKTKQFPNQVIKINR